MSNLLHWRDRQDSSPGKNVTDFDDEFLCARRKNVIYCGFLPVFCIKPAVPHKKAGSQNSEKGGESKNARGRKLDKPFPS